MEYLLYLFDWAGKHQFLAIPAFTILLAITILLIIWVKLTWNLFEFFFNLKRSRNSDNLKIWMFALHYTFKKSLSNSELKQFKLACQQGDVKKIKSVLKNRNLPHLYIVYDEFYLACQLGHLKVVKYLSRSQKIKPWFNKNTVVSQTAIETAIKNNHLHVIKYLYGSFLDQKDESKHRLSHIILMALTHNQLEVLKYFLNFSEDSISLRDSLSSFLSLQGHDPDFEENCEIVAALLVEESTEKRQITLYNFIDLLTKENSLAHQILGRTLSKVILETRLTSTSYTKKKVLKI